MSTPAKKIAQRPKAVWTAWDEIAAGYDEFVTPTHLWLGNEGLKRAGLRAGMLFLDVAAGSGALSIPAARLGARVLATDVSAVMLERLAARAVAAGLELETRAMDGHVLELDDDRFDVAGSQFGVMLFADMPRGIRELARVTRPGGRVLITAYGAPRQIEFLQFFARAVKAVVPAFPGIPEDPPPLPFQLQDTARLEHELRESGLRDVHVETVQESLEFRSGDALWRWLVNSNPVVDGILVEVGLDQDQRDQVRRVLDGMVDRRRKPGAAAILTNPINIGIGTK